MDYLTAESNKKIVNKDGIAESLNTYFCTIGQKISEKIKNPNNIEANMSNNCNNTIFLRRTSKSEIVKILLKMNNKARVVDGIGVKVLKTIINSVALPLIHIYDQCINLGIWTDALKKAEVIPTHKGKQKYKAENYSLILLISNIG